MNMFDPVAKLEREHAANLARVEGLKVEIDVKGAQKDAQLQAGASFEALVAADAEIQELNRKVIIAEGVAANSAERLAQAKAEAEDRARLAKSAAMQKRQRVGIKSIGTLLSDCRDLRIRLREAVAEEKAFEDFAAQHRDLPYIESPERAARMTPTRTFPAVTRREWAWINEKGERPSQLRDDGKGRLVPADGYAYDWREVEVVVQQERVIPATMPPRLSELLEALDRVLGQ